MITSSFQYRGRRTGVNYPTRDKNENFGGKGDNICDYRNSSIKNKHTKI